MTKTEKRIYKTTFDSKQKDRLSFSFYLDKEIQSEDSDELITIINKLRDTKTKYLNILNQIETFLDEKGYISFRLMHYKFIVD